MAHSVDVRVTGEESLVASVIAAIKQVDWLGYLVLVIAGISIAALALR